MKINDTNFHAAPATMLDTSDPTGAGGPEILTSETSSLLTSGDPGAALAALALNMGRSEREANQALSASAERLQDAEEQQQLDDMHTHADCALAAGIVQGTATAASGALTAGSAFNKLDADEIGQSIKDGNVSAHGAEQAAHDCSSSAIKEQAAATTATAVGQLSGALLQYGGATAETGATAHGQAADHAKASVNDARDGIEEARKLVDKALDFYKEYKTTKDQTTEIAARRA